MRNTRSGNTLVGLLVAIAIIAILAVVYFMPNGGKSTRKDGKGTTMPGAVMMKSKDTVCQNNLSQIRQLIYVQTETSGEDADLRPKSIEQINGLPISMRVCPIGQEPYVLDPETLKVRCVHPGHENY